MNKFSYLCVMRNTLLLIIALLFVGKISAQENKDTLFLMNGKIYVSKVLDTLLGGVTIKDLKDTSKRFTVDNDDLFSVHYSTGDLVYYYTQDTAIGNEFTRDEMNYFMAGERDAKKGFKARGSFFGSMACGFAGGLSGNLLGPVLPFAYMGLCGIPKVRIRHNTISNPYLIDHDPYILGYERQARSKRRIQCLIGGGIGLVAGYATNIIVAKTSGTNLTIKIKF
ncbi:MAG: hypothetical protein Q8M29_00025 [Bacteroidota bacterium]|nr:hypothetical protein [Bacteroidota bacterium]